LIKFTVTTVKENEDGSANVVLDLDNEAREYLLNYAFTHMLKEAIEEGKKYQVKDSDVHPNL
jgi:hypothetical protein